MPLAQQERMTARSSAHPATCRHQSEIHRPPWPHCFHSRLSGKIGELYSPIAVMRPLVKLGGSGWPAFFFNASLGSNVSRCDGPPSMNRKMTFLARGRNGDGRGARGETMFFVGAAKS